jgi:hypothetical protein
MNNSLVENEGLLKRIKEYYELKINRDDFNITRFGEKMKEFK